MTIDAKQLAKTLTRVYGNYLAVPVIVHDKSTGRLVESGRYRMALIAPGEFHDPEPMFIGEASSLAAGKQLVRTFRDSLSSAPQSSASSSSKSTIF